MAEDNIKPIELIGDQPILDPKASDLLDMSRSARILAGVALGTEGPFTIGVYGGWGVGKTSMLRCVESVIQAQGKSNVVTVWFDPWQFEREEHPLFPLIAAIIAALQGKAKIKGFFRDLHNCLKALLASMEINAAPLGVGVKTSLTKAVEIDEKLRTNVLRRETIYPEAFKCLTDTTNKGAGKVIVFVDDLDRCLPGNAIRLLEGIKLVLAQQSFVFVLALDNRMVESFLTKRFRDEYGIEDAEVAETYLHKLVQLEFPIPDHRDHFSEYVENLLAKSEETRALLRIKPVLIAAAQNSPRSLVRLVNSLVVDRMLWSGTPTTAPQDERWQEDDVLTCMVVSREVRRRLGLGPLRRLVDDPDLCERWLQADGGVETSDFLVRLFPEGKLPPEEARDLGRRVRGLSNLLQGPGRIWLTEETLRRRLYTFFRARETGSDVPESQRVIVDRAVRNELGLAPDSQIEEQARKKITRLDLSYRGDFGDAGMSLLADLNSLQQLYLPDTGITDAGMTHLTGLTNLQVLGLWRTQVTDSGLACLVDMTSLQELYLSDTEITGAGLAHLAGMAGLHWLDLAKTRIENAELAHVAGLPSLETLDVRDTQVSDAGLVHLAALTGLRLLELSGTSVSNDGLSHLADLTNLQRLHLAHTLVSDAGLAHLDRLTNLEVLSLECTRISDAGLGYLARMSGLRALNLRKTRVSDTGLLHISGLTGVMELLLDGTKVGDLGLARLSNLTRVQALHLSDTQVSDAGLAHVEGLASLRDLTLTGTQVSMAGVEALRKKLPACRIAWT